MTAYRTLTIAFNDLKAIAWTKPAQPEWDALEAAIAAFAPVEAPVEEVSNVEAI